MRLTYSQPKIGMVLGVLMVISFTFLVIIIGLIYRRQGAVYYTHEKSDVLDGCLAAGGDDIEDLKSDLNKKTLLNHHQPQQPATITDDFITINPSIESFSTYTSFEPRLRY